MLASGLRVSSLSRGLESTGVRELDEKEQKTTSWRKEDERSSLASHAHVHPSLDGHVSTLSQRIRIDQGIVSREAIVCTSSW